MAYGPRAAQLAVCLDRTRRRARRRDPDPAGHLSAARRQPVHLPHRRAVAGRRAPPPRARPFQHAERRSRQRHSVILDDLGVRPAGDRPYRALDVHLIPRRPAHFHQALRRQCEELDGEQHRLAAGQPQDARRAPASGPRRPVPAHRPACGRSSVWATLEGGCLALHRPQGAQALQRTPSRCSRQDTCAPAMV